MKQSLERRLQMLEDQSGPTSTPRIWVWFGAEGSESRLFLDGHWFDREHGETTEQLMARARRTIDG